MDSFHLPQGTWAMEAIEPVLGWFSGGSATPWTFAPGFSPPASSLACQVPIVQKPQGSSARLAGLFCVLAHRCHESSPQVSMGQLWEPTLTKGTSSLSRGSEAPRF